MNRFVFLQGSLCCPLFSGTVCKHLAGGCLPTTLPVQQETGEFSQGLLQRIGKYLQLVFLGTHLAVVLLPVPVKRIWRLDTSFLLGSKLGMEVGYLVPRWLLDSNVSWYAWATSEHGWAENGETQSTCCTGKGEVWIKPSPECLCCPSWVWFAFVSLTKLNLSLSYL